MCQTENKGGPSGRPFPLPKNNRLMKATRTASAVNGGGTVSRQSSASPMGAPARTDAQAQRKTAGGAKTLIGGYVRN